MHKKAKTITKLVLESLFSLLITHFFEKIILLITNPASLPPIDHFYGILGILGIIGASIIGYQLVLQFYRYVISRIGEKQLINEKGIPTRGTSRQFPYQRKSAEYKLDDLMQEIELFIKRWKTTAFLKTSYRRQIELKSMDTDRKKVREHARQIHRKIKPLRNLDVEHTTVILNSIDDIADKMSDLGWEIEKVFSLRLKEINATEPEKFNKLLSDGDVICSELESIIPQLDRLRRNLP